MGSFGHCWSSHGFREERACAKGRNRLWSTASFALDCPASRLNLSVSCEIMNSFSVSYLPPLFFPNNLLMYGCLNFSKPPSRELTPVFIISLLDMSLKLQLIIGILFVVTLCANAADTVLTYTSEDPLDKDYLTRIIDLALIRIRQQMGDAICGYQQYAQVSEQEILSYLRYQLTSLSWVSRKPRSKLNSLEMEKLDSHEKAFWAGLEQVPTLNVTSSTQYV